MTELREVKGTRRNMRGARQAPAGTERELVKAEPSALAKETRGGASSGQVAILETVKKTWRGNGLERLQKAADRRLGNASEKLADLLLDKAKEGKVESTQLLVKLAERKKERKPQEKNKKKRSMGSRQVEQLCSEPEWVEEKPEVGDVWVGDGWKNERTGRFVPAPR
jgi:hypothetical protein